MLKEEFNYIYKCIAELNYKERYILIHTYGLYNKDRMTNKKIADSLNISVNTLIRLRKIALTKIRIKLKIHEYYY